MGYRCNLGCRWWRYGWKKLILTLSLDGTQVTDLAPLKGLTALQTLFLNGTQVTDLAPLKGLTALQRLDLDGTQVTDLAPLKGLTALKSLYLQGTPVTEEEIAALRAALPGTTLIRKPAGFTFQVQHPS